MKPSLASYTPGAPIPAPEGSSRRLRPSEAFARNYRALITAQNRLAHGEKPAAVAKALGLPTRAITTIITPADIAWEQRRLVDLYLEEELTPTEIMSKMRLRLPELNRLLPEGQQITQPPAPDKPRRATASDAPLRRKNYGFAKDPAQVAEALCRRAHGQSAQQIATHFDIHYTTVYATSTHAEVRQARRDYIAQYRQSGQSDDEICRRLHVSAKVFTDLLALSPSGIIRPVIEGLPMAAPSPAPKVVSCATADSTHRKYKNFGFAKDPAQIAEALRRRAHGESGEVIAAHFNVHFTTVYAVSTPAEVNQARRDYVEQYRQIGLSDDAIRERLRMTERKFASMLELSPSGLIRPMGEEAPVAAASPVVAAPAPTAPAHAKEEAPVTESARPHHTWTGLTPGLPADLVAYQQRNTPAAPPPTAAPRVTPAPRAPRTQRDAYTTPGAVKPGMGPYDCVKPAPDASGLRIAGSAIRYRSVRLIPDHVEEEAPPPPPTMGCTLMGDESLHAKVMKRLVHGEPSRDVAADYNLTTDDMRQYLDWKLLQEAKRRQLDAYRDEGMPDGTICQKMRLNERQFEALVSMPAPGPVVIKPAPAPVAPPPACA